ncbi:desaturase [Yasminevirus sp. GU-2018]|uniref:Desaturase n=1 Tax=Yasminevirus sp. GU-2018 TaxID=2420051 RepID=A0A5K0UBG6_9VIRU|nr:desaturase [Yasminevirus sp. GU-2018]
MKWYGPTQFALFRIILGVYLTVHFAQLIPIGKEAFSNQGVISDASVLPSYGKVPVFLFDHDDPIVVTGFLWSLVIASALFTCGVYRRISSLWLYYGWMSLLNRNPLISNPSLGYIGWILLACATIPKGERLGFLMTQKQRDDEEKKKNPSWQVPDILFYGMWLIIGVSYAASGIHKLQCASWLDGTALYYVLTGPLVRQNNPIVDIILSDMMFINMMTWGSLFLEISCLFLGTFYRTRKSYWVMFMGFHIGILTTVNFTDLTLGMIIAHLFTFDASWFEFTKKLVEKYDYNGKKIVEFDINHSDHFNSKRMVDNVYEGVERSVTKIKAKTAGFAETLDGIHSAEDLVEKIGDLVEPTGRNILSWVMYSVVIGLIGIVLSAKGDIHSSLVRLTEITVDMYWGFGFLVGAMGFLMTLERIFPDQELKYVPGWWKWVMIINIFQLFAVILASFTWENWLQNTSYFTSSTGFHLRDHVSPFWGGVIAYVINQWLFYHFHHARHQVYFLWVTLHQFHHSASRIEAITSFYKHPLEIMVDSQIMAVLLYSLLGLTNEASIWLSIFSGFGEYFYHMNIKTPRWIGYFFQRPESHRCHHRKNKRQHCPNFSDFPLWDILGGTFENPERMDDATGFSSHLEVKRLDMLFFKDVITGVYQDIFCDYYKIKKTCIRFFWYALVIWGALTSTAFIAHHDGMKEVGFVTVSSPLPLVFSAYRGVETFATAFDVQIQYQNGTVYNTHLDVERYNLLSGAYNRKNIYGAVFSHGPFFDQPNLIKIRQDILKYAVCDPGIIVKEFGADGDVEHVHVNILNRRNGNEKIGELEISCVPA